MIAKLKDKGINQEPHAFVGLYVILVLSQTKSKAI